MIRPTVRKFENRLSANAGLLTVVREVQFESSSITNYYVSNAQTRTIQYMFDYKYEFWDYCTTWGTPLGETREYWYSTKFRSLSGRLYSPYPSPYRTKSVSDNTLPLAAGDSRELTYNDLSGTAFGFSVGVSFDKAWKVYKSSVPLASFSHLSGKYEGLEAVYKLTNPTNYYRQWRVYEWGADSGTSQGWVCSFNLTL